MKGERDPSSKTASKVVDKLPLDPSAKQTLLLSLVNGNVNAIPKDSSFQHMSDEEMTLAAGWEPFTIMELLDVEDNFHRPEDVSKAIGVEVERIRHCLDNLQKLGAITQETATGRYRSTGKKYTTRAGCMHPGIIQAQKSYIEKAIRAYEDYNPETSNISGITVATSKSKIKEAIDRIGDFRRSLGHFLDETGPVPKDAVYRINVQFFPIYRKDKA
jgi:uncharacterized protein (TIGR02147 family)